MKLHRLSEAEKLFLSFIISVIIVRLAFFSESWIAVLKVCLLIYWMFVLPGIGITYLLKEITFFERFAISIAISAALLGTSAYYLGILGIHAKYSAIVLPVLFSLVSAAIMSRELKKINNNAP